MNEANTKTVWIDGMLFEGQVGKHKVPMDVQPPLGHDKGPTPKQLLILSTAGCTGMDIVGLLKKNKQVIHKLEIETVTTKKEIGYPVTFDTITLHYKLEGEIDKDLAHEAVTLSQSKYCGVSAMLSEAVNIKWTLEVNGEDAGYGQANFYLSKE